jgi:hypothetical protein
LYVTPETMQAHRIRWFGVVGNLRVPRNRHMAAKDWGWDVECSCGWKSRTGGALHVRIREAIEDHRWEAEFEATHVWNRKTMTYDELPS